MFDYETLKHICTQCGKEMKIIFSKRDGQGGYDMWGCPDHKDERDYGEDTTWKHPWKKD